MLVRVWVVLSAAAFVAGACARRFVTESFTVPTVSMAPTLLRGDVFVVDKLAGSPSPGDVIVFEFPLDPSTNYVKRVVAVAGDVVEIVEGRLTINGKEVWRERVQNGCSAGEQDGVPCVIWEETLGERRYQTGYEENGAPGHMVRRTVQPGSVFVLGDNRDNSSDSRVWGDVPLANVKGTARFVWWSWAPDGAIRRGRINQPVR
jgi:signal peptidase I